MTAMAQTSRRAISVPVAQSWSWGVVPALSLTAAIGLLLVAAGNRGAAVGEWWAEGAFYIGLLVIFLPIGIRLLLPDAEGTERVTLVALLAVALFLCKVVHDPLRVGGYDEFLHWRTAQDITLSGNLFTPNTLLGVSPYYPGLELVTASLSTMAGISIFDAGLIVLFAARIVFLLALFFFFAMVSGSSRAAGIACLVYMTNPKFLYFNAQFAYESLALPLAALVLYLLARRGHSGPARWIGLTIVAFVTLPAIVVTHHVTSAMIAGFLVLWALTGLVLRRRERARPGTVAVSTLVLIAGWTLLVATATIGYLAPALTSTLTEVVRLAFGEMEARELFVSRSGDVAPVWERLVGSLSAGVILVLLPLGLIVVWRRYRANPAMMALAAAAALFPATLVARLTQVGSEVAGRTPEFLYIGIGIVVALALARLSFKGRRGVAQTVGAGVLLSILVVGGVLVGLPPWARLPGPYLVSADNRSVESEGIAAAQWSHDVLGSDNVMIADRVNRILMSTFGRQEMVTAYETRVPVRNLYLSPEIEATQREIVRAGDIQYLVADRRLTTGPPVIGHYFDRGEGELFEDDDKALDRAFLDKFDRQPDVSRIFDSGNIQIYDVSAIADGD